MTDNSVTKRNSESRGHLDCLEHPRQITKVIIKPVEHMRGEEKKNIQEANRNCVWCADMVGYKHIAALVWWQPKNWVDSTLEIWHKHCFWEWVYTTHITHLGGFKDD